SARATAKQKKSGNFSECVDNFAAMVRWRHHYNPPQLRNAVCGQVVTQQYSAQGVGDKVDWPFRELATLLQPSINRRGCKLFYSSSAGIVGNVAGTVPVGF